MKRLLSLVTILFAFLLIIQGTAIAKDIPLNKFDKDSNYLLCSIQKGASKDQSQRVQAYKFYLNKNKIRVVVNNNPTYIVYCEMVRVEYIGNSIKGYRYTEKFKYDTAKNELYIVSPSRQNDTDFDWRPISYHVSRFQKHDTKCQAVAAKKAFSLGCNLTILQDVPDGIEMIWNDNGTSATITEKYKNQKDKKYTE